MTDAATAIRTEGVAKRFGDVTAVDSLSLTSLWVLLVGRVLAILFAGGRLTDQPTVEAGIEPAWFVYGHRLNPAKSYTGRQND